MAKYVIHNLTEALPLSHPHFLREKGVLKYIPVSRYKFSQMIKNGEFPAPKKIGPMIAVWPSYQVQDYLESHGCSTEVRKHV